MVVNWGCKVVVFVCSLVDFSFLASHDVIHLRIAVDRSLILGAALFANMVETVGTLTKSDFSRQLVTSFGT